MPFGMPSRRCTSLVAPANRSDSAANAQGARRQHQVLARGADVSALVFGDDEQQDWRTRIVVGVGAEVQRRLAGAVTFGNVLGARKAAFLAPRPVGIHVPQRELRLELRSRTARKRHGCRLPPLGARAAAVRMVSRSASLIGSDFRRRIARWVKRASPSGIVKRSAAGMRSELPRGLACSRRPASFWRRRGR